MQRTDETWGIQRTVEHTICHIFNKLRDAYTALGNMQSRLATFLKPFQAKVPFLYSLKTSGNLWVFLTFSGGVEREHWSEMG